jgi:hypothetical protein
MEIIEGRQTVSQFLPVVRGRQTAADNFKIQNCERGLSISR